MDLMDAVPEGSVNPWGTGGGGGGAAAAAAAAPAADPWKNYGKAGLHRYN